MFFQKTKGRLSIISLAVASLFVFSVNSAFADQTDDVGINSSSSLSSTSTPSSSTGASTAGGTGGVTLQGGVKHAEQLTGLPDGLKLGKVYSDDLLISPDTKINNEWFLIPDWYAGTRHCEDCMIVHRYDYATKESSSPMLKQMNRQTSVSGYQKDRNGGIWDFKRVPQIQHVESNFENAVLYVKDITLLSEVADRIVVKYIIVSIGINKKSGKIRSIVQQEQINTVTSPVENVLRSDVSVKAFDSDGKPQRQEQSVIMADIIKPYEQIDTYEGQDLRPLFRDFLISHGLEKLVPTDLESSSTK